MIQNVLTFILAGGKTRSLGILDDKRAKAAIPFGGIYRIIDFALSNLSNSGIQRIGVLTQYRPSSLIDHLGFGKPWDLVGRSREVRMLPPYTGGEGSSWYKGTVDAVFQNINFIETYAPEHVLIVSGEHIYNLDFNDVYAFHVKKNADVTLVVKALNDNEKNLDRFGVVELDAHGRVKSYEEKPAKPKSNCVSLTMYLFKTDVLLKEIQRDARNQTSKHNFGFDIFPQLLKKYNVFGYTHKGPWYYVGNIDEYWHANMLMLGSKPAMDPETWGVRTNADDRDMAERSPAYLSATSSVKNSVISRGCVIHGEVTNSVLFPGVIVEQGARVSNSVIMHDSHISAGSTVERAVFDKDVFLGKRVTIGKGENLPNTVFAEYYHSGITVLGKSTRIPDGMSIGKNCLIFDGVNERTFEEQRVVSGVCVYKNNQ